MASEWRVASLGVPVVTVASGEWRMPGRVATRRGESLSGDSPAAGPGGEWRDSGELVCRSHRDGGEPEWRVASGEWRLGVASGEWRVASGEW